MGSCYGSRLNTFGWPSYILDHQSSEIDNTDLEPYDFEHKFECKNTCSICSTPDFLVTINQVHIPSKNLQIFIPDSELRCLLHIYYVTCTYCGCSFDAHHARSPNNWNETMVLCPQDKSPTCCHNCGKWRRYDSTIGPYICTCYDSNHKNKQYSVIPKPRKYSTLMSWREALLRRLGEDCYRRYIEHHNKNYSTVSKTEMRDDLDNELSLLLRQVDKTVNMLSSDE